MKRAFAWSLCLPVVALCIAGCSGGWDEYNSELPPSPTSTRSIEATASVMMFAYESFAQILPQLAAGSAMVVKADSSDFSFSCGETAYSGFSCIGTDLNGRECAVTGSGSEDLSSFTMSYDCDQFRLDSETAISGSFDVALTLHNPGAAMTAKGLSTGKTGSNECDTGDDSTSFDNGLCTEGGTCTLSSTGLVAVLDITVTGGGLALVNPCSTFFFYDPGLTIGENLCSDSATVTMGFGMNGTFNDETVDYSGTWTCSYAL